MLNNETYHNEIPIVHGVLSLSAVVIRLVLSQIILYCNYSTIFKSEYTGVPHSVTNSPTGNDTYMKNNNSMYTSDSNTNLKNIHQELRCPVAVISVNIIYIGCYFLPYMVLAFIHDPFLTAFIYFMVALVVFCVYLIFLGVWHLVKFFKYKYSDYEDRIRCAKLLDHLLYSCMT